MDKKQEIGLYSLVPVNSNDRDDYLNRRAEEIINTIDTTKLINAMEDYYNLGQAAAYGCFLYMLKQDNINTRTLENYIMNMLNDNKQIRNDAFCILGELCSKNR